MPTCLSRKHHLCQVTFQSWTFPPISYCIFTLFASNSLIKKTQLFRGDFSFLLRHFTLFLPQLVSESNKISVQKIIIIKMERKKDDGIFWLFQMSTNIQQIEWQRNLPSTHWTKVFNRVQFNPISWLIQRLCVTLRTLLLLIRYFVCKLTDHEPHICHTSLAFSWKLQATTGTFQNLSSSIIWCELLATFFILQIIVIKWVTQTVDNWAATWENRIFANAKTKTQISFAVTAKLISVFVFATRIVQSLYFLNPKFRASSHLQWLSSLVCVGPGRNPRRLVFWRRGPINTCFIIFSIKTFNPHFKKVNISYMYKNLGHNMVILDFK